MVRWNQRHDGIERADLANSPLAPGPRTNGLPITEHDGRTPEDALAADASWPVVAARRKRRC
jgi:hypothetical protein